MANFERSSAAKKRRYRVREQNFGYRFLDVYAADAAEALDIAANTEDFLFHEIENEGDWELEEVVEIADDDDFYPSHERGDEIT